ncbi:MAG: hypothetical protein SNJ57_19470 [Cyanobacteriota bacterium]
MKVINLTPHTVQFYAETQFVNLRSTGPTVWVADGVEGDPIAEFESSGSARIATSTVEGESINGIPTVRTHYGEAVGLPESVDPGDVLIVSLPMQSMAKSSGHPLASQMAAPYKVVRLASDTSKVLGAMGLTF